ncbi:MAG: DUF5685 family protein [Angelakisella sp.]
MFGYVKAWKPELRICEFEAYKAVYCGLCKDMGKRFGLWAHFTLSYDFTFLAMLGMAMEEKDPQITPARCPFNPLKKMNTCKDSAALTFAGDVAMLMLWHKLEDNRADGGFWERVASAAAILFVKGAYKKAVGNLPELSDIMKEAMRTQAALEKENCADLDRICHPSAHMLGSVLQTFAHDEGQSRVLYRLGYLMGRYVYISDALDDLEQDEKEQGYNPLLLGAAAHVGSENETVRMGAQGSLFMTIAEAGTAYELLEIKRFAPILENILFLGLRKNVEIITLPRGERPKNMKY